MQHAQFSSVLNTYAHARAATNFMKRTDLKIEPGKITIHPRKLAALKKEARARIGSDGRAILRDAIVDEEIEMYVEQIVVEEIENELRTEVRSMIAEALGR